MRSRFSCRAASLALTIFAGLSLSAGCGGGGGSTPSMNVTFTRIADKSMSEFAAVDRFDLPSINGAGTAAFQVDVTFTNFLAGAIYKGSGGAVTKIADPTAGALGGVDDHVTINDAGTVAFHASDVTSIFTGSGGALTLVANTSQVPGGLAPIGAPAINAVGAVAFAGTNAAVPPTDTRLFLKSDAGITTLQQTQAGGFASLGNVAMNDSGVVAFQGMKTDASQGVYVRSAAGVVSVIADINTPGRNGFSFGNPVINSGGMVALRAIKNSQVSSQAILVGSGGAPTTVADTTSVASPFVSFGEPSINDNGSVAFLGLERDGTKGVFVLFPGASTPVPIVKVGDAMFGSSVVQLDFGRNALNNANQLAFIYALQDGSIGIAVANVQR